MSRRVDNGGTPQCYGICEFGYQGLLHDEEIGLIYNRARELHPTLGRFMQRNLLEYGMVQTAIRSALSQPDFSPDDEAMAQRVFAIVGELNSLRRRSLRRDNGAQSHFAEKRRELRQLIEFAYGISDVSGTGNTLSPDLYLYEDGNPITSRDSSGLLAGFRIPFCRYTTQADDQDNECSFPIPGFVNNCEAMRQCCVNHDRCYVRNNCNSSSWLPWCGSIACNGCNLGAELCVASAGQLGRLDPQYGQVIPPPATPYRPRR
jgi:hypothetical protein